MAALDGGAAATGPGAWRPPESRRDGQTGEVKVFVSSTRAGLADDRNALPGILRLDLHDPVVYQGVRRPGRAEPGACLRAVAGSDAVVLLLGAEYGARMPDTGVSPTEEEWRVARGFEKPVLVFRKRGAEPTAEQSGFVAEVGDFAAGRFWAEFDGVGDLLPAVARALRALGAGPAAPTYEQLPGPVEVPWGTAPRGGVNTAGPLLEVHVVPVGGRPFPARIMAGLPDRLTEGIRQARVIPAGSAPSGSVPTGPSTTATDGWRCCCARPRSTDRSVASSSRRSSWRPRRSVTGRCSDSGTRSGCLAR